MKNTAALVIIAGALLAGCATRAPLPTATATQAATVPTTPTITTAEVATAAPTNTPTSTPTATPTPEPTNTSTPVPTYTLSGTVFFDYNGNGLRDLGEPPIEGAPVRVAGFSTTSGPDGSYSLVGVPAGSQQVYVKSPTEEPATAFRYISLSLEAFQPVEEPIRFMLDGDKARDIALTQGFLTTPYSCTDMQSYWVWGWFDHDPTQGSVRNHLGDATLFYPSVSDPVVGTEDGHTGIDYGVPEGVPVVASAPGVVEAAGVGQFGTPDNPTLPGELYVEIDHGFGLYTTYHHLGEVGVSQGEMIARGQRIGLSGSSGGHVPLLHFDVWIADAPVFPHNFGTQFDPYRDLLDPSAVGYWTVDNSPQCLP
jgi:hypothetical protein